MEGLYDLNKKGAKRVTARKLFQERNSTLNNMPSYLDQNNTPIKLN